MGTAWEVSLPHLVWRSGTGHGEAVELEHRELTGRIIGTGIAVHKELGPGFLESVYENALVLELQERGLKVRRQFEVPVLYRGVEVGVHRLDLFVEDEIVVELKAVKTIADVHFSVVRSYLRAVGRKAWPDPQLRHGNPGVQTGHSGSTLMQPASTTHTMTAVRIKSANPCILARNRRNDHFMTHALLKAPSCLPAFLSGNEPPSPHPMTATERHP